MALELPLWEASGVTSLSLEEADPKALCGFSAEGGPAWLSMSGQREESRAGTAPLGGRRRACTSWWAQESLPLTHQTGAAHSSAVRKGRPLGCHHSWRAGAGVFSSRNMQVSKTWLPPFFLPPGTRRGLWSQRARPVFPGPIRSLGIPSLGYSKSKACRGWMGALWGSTLITCAVATAASFQTAACAGPALLLPSPSLLGELVSACRDPCFR